jgi:DNA polymerase-3 subunit delta'
VVREKDKKGDSGPPLSDDWLEEWREFIGESAYQNSYQWLQYINAENRQGNITVRECKSIIKKLNLKTYEGQYKILLMWMPEYLGNNGNVLLKVLEEPPPNTLFLFVAENQDALLNTVLSRLQLVKVHPLSDEAIQQSLTQNHTLSQEEAAHVAHLAAGNYTEALQLLDQSHKENLERFSHLIDLCLNQKPMKRVDWVEEVARLGRENQKHFLKYCLHLLRETLLHQHHEQRQPKAHESETGRIKKLSKLLSSSQLEEIIRTLNEAHYGIERNAHPKGLFFHLCTQLTRQFHKHSEKSMT